MNITASSACRNDTDVARFALPREYMKFMIAPIIPKKDRAMNAAVRSADRLILRCFGAGSVVSGFSW